MATEVTIDGTFEQVALNVQFITGVVPETLGVATYECIISNQQFFGLSVPEISYELTFNNDVSYTAPAGPTDPDFDKVELLLHMDGADGGTVFLDSSKNTFPVTAYGTAQTDSDIVKYGTASGYFDGSTGYLDLLPSTAFDYGTGDFTVEFWFRSPETRVGGFGRVLGHPVSTNVTGGFQIWHASSASFGSIVDGVALALPTGSGVIVKTTVPVTPLGWCHIAFTRRAGIARCFLNGELQETAASSENFNLGGVEGIRIGNRGDLAATTYLKGNLDDLRITKGYARYVENFTAPTAPFPNTGGPTVTITTMAPDWRRPRRAI